MIVCAHFFFIALVSSIIPLHAGQVYHLTLDDAVAQGLQHRPDLQAFIATIESAQWKAQTALTDYYPNISLNASTTTAHHARGIQHQTTLEGRQLIYEFGGPIERYKLGLLYKKQIMSQQKSSTHAIRFAIEQSFLLLWFLQQQSHLIKTQYSTARQVFQRAALEYEHEVLDRSGYLHAQTNFSYAQSEVELYLHDLAVAQSSLTFLMGSPYPITIIKDPSDRVANHYRTKLLWKPSKMIRLKPLATYHAYAQKYRPDLQEQETLRQFKQQSLSITQQQNLPKISLFGSVTHTNNNDISYHPQQIGLSISWPIFDGTLTDHQTKQAAADLQAHMLNLEQKKKHVSQDVTEAYFTLKKSISRCNARQSFLNQARNDFILKQDQCRLGEISPTTFQEALAAWKESYFLWLKDIIDVFIHERHLAFVCGYPHEFNNTKER